MDEEMIVYSPDVSEDFLRELQALQDHGLKLTFEDVLAGLEKAKRPHTAGIMVDRIAEKIEEAYRLRTRAIPAAPVE